MNEEKLAIKRIKLKELNDRQRNVFIAVQNKQDYNRLPIITQKMSRTYIVLLGIYGILIMFLFTALML